MYLDSFSNEDFVNLINLCINSEIAWESLDDTSKVVDLALVSDEEERRLVTGERYYWIRGVKRGSIPKFIGEFKATDFGMASSEGKKDYSVILKRYMVNKFGEKYVTDLYNHRLAEASLESEQLLAYLETRNSEVNRN